MTYKTRKTLKLYRSIDSLNKVFRRLGGEEIICDGDYTNSKGNPVDSGFLMMTGINPAGTPKCAKSGCLWYYREVK